MDKPAEPTRRAVTAAAVLGACTLLGVCSACSKDNDGGQVQKIVDQKAKEIIQLDQIPEGRGVVVPSANVVVIRGKGDSVWAFDAICTHAGCTVSEVTADSIECPCHGSKFDPKTGKVTHGPATKNLPRVIVEVRNGVVLRA
ncbi:Rieske (2Fe-2S) protein [Streptomyces sp. NPDC002952]|uniref:Rieske (2Fe-2S) protein n=1 Tax=Streptomyces sp. NPDC002952 TaxID=3364673 RepID=UPI0036894053